MWRYLQLGCQNQALEGADLKNCGQISSIHRLPLLGNFPVEKNGGDLEMDFFPPNMTETFRFRN